MVESFLRTSPLAHLGLAGRAIADQAEGKAVAAVVMGERPFPGLVNLRGRADDTGFQEAVKAVLGIAVPSEPNTTTNSGEVTLFWLGPDEWWVVTPDDGPAMAVKLRAALEGQRAAVTDVSDSRTCIRVQGPHARDLLAKGCPLDLHPRVFSPGRCAQSHCAKTMVTLHQVSGDEDEGGPAFDVYVLNSFAEYLWLWLEDAAREYGMAVSSG